MGVLSDSEILEYIERGWLRIDPFSEGSLGAAGYDLRSGSPLSLLPGTYCLAHTTERIELSGRICGQLLLRSSFAREGLVGSFALVDPGFRGQLTLSLSNFGPQAISIGEGERLAQVVFMKMSRLPKKSYSGRYQDSTGAVGSRRKF